MQGRGLCFLFLSFVRFTSVSSGSPSRALSLASSLTDFAVSVSALSTMMISITIGIPIVSVIRDHCYSTSREITARNSRLHICCTTASLVFSKAATIPEGDPSHPSHPHPPRLPHPPSPPAPWPTHPLRSNGTGDALVMFARNTSMSASIFIWKNAEAGSRHRSRELQGSQDRKQDFSAIV